MLIDQGEINALRSQAEGAAPQAAPRPGGDARREAAATPATAQTLPPNIARLLRIRVPVIARLVSRRMHVSFIRKLSLGTILEFEKNVEEPLDLLINNRCIGRGETVKVGERFGVRIFEIADRPSLIRSMGR